MWLTVNPANCTADGPVIGNVKGYVHNSWQSLLELSAFDAI